MVFKSNAVVDETHIRKTTNACKTTFGLNASPIDTYSLRQSMHTGLYARYELDADLQRFESVGINVEFS